MTDYTSSFMLTKKKNIMYVVFILLLILFVIEIFQPEQKTNFAEEHNSSDLISNNDDAVRTYLTMARLHAEIFKYTNNNSYNGLCENSDKLYTLEGGILKYIKSVGATEVFCSTSEANYLIEVQLPINKMFYCIDSTHISIEQQDSKEGSVSCL